MPRTIRVRDSSTQTTPSLMMKLTPETQVREETPENVKEPQHSSYIRNLTVPITTESKTPQDFHSSDYKIRSPELEKNLQKRQLKFEDLQNRSSSEEIGNFDFDDELKMPISDGSTGTEIKTRPTNFSKKDMSPKKSANKKMFYFESESESKEDHLEGSFENNSPKISNPKSSTAKKSTIKITKNHDDIPSGQKTMKKMIIDEMSSDENHENVDKTFIKSKKDKLAKGVHSTENENESSTEVIDSQDSYYELQLIGENTYVSLKNSDLRKKTPGTSSSIGTGIKIRSKSRSKSRSRSETPAGEHSEKEYSKKRSESKTTPDFGDSGTGIKTRSKSRSRSQTPAVEQSVKESGHKKTPGSSETEVGMKTRSKSRSKSRSKLETPSLKDIKYETPKIKTGKIDTETGLKTRSKSTSKSRSRSTIHPVDQNENETPKNAKKKTSIISGKEMESRSKSTSKSRSRSQSTETPIRMKKTKTVNFLSTSEETPKKRGRPRKTPKSSDTRSKSSSKSRSRSKNPSIEDNENETPKKRSKSSKAQMDNHIEVEMNSRPSSSISHVNTTEMPRKRGRPSKIVSEIADRSKINSKSRSRSESLSKPLSDYETPVKRARPKKVPSSATIGSKKTKSESKVSKSEPSKMKKMARDSSETPVSTRSRIIIERSIKPKRALEVDSDDEVVVSSRSSPHVKLRKLEKRCDDLRKQIAFVEHIANEYYHPDKKLRRSQRIRAYMIRRLENEMKNLKELVELLEKQAEIVKHYIMEKEKDGQS